MSDWLRNAMGARGASQLPSGRSFSAITRRENLDCLAQETFDLLVIGGGITGAAIARDAAMRGIRTALVEKDDFASGTSGHSSRLIHGGIRYLEYYQFKLVFEACCERRILRRTAPCLVRPLPFLYPLYRDQKPAPWKLRLGLTIYDAMGLFRNIQRHRWLRPSEVQERESTIAQEQLLGAARFYDAQVDDARLTLVTAKSAHFHGAVVANHLRVVDLMTAEGRVVGACLVDEESDREIEVRASAVVNATGVWGDDVRAMDMTSRDPMLRPTKGVHLTIPHEKLEIDHAIVFDSPRDGRHVFLIPWERLVLLGTTDTDYEGDLDSPAADSEDVIYLLEALENVVSHDRIDSDDVVSTFAGLRPLIAAPGGTYTVSREHQIVESDSGLVTIAGGKLTTHRLMAEQVVDRVQERLASAFHKQSIGECCTQDSAVSPQSEEVLVSNLAGPTRDHLISVYGADAARILGYVEGDPGLAEPIVNGLPYLMGEALYAVHHEMALTLNDFLVRRTHILYEKRSGGLERARTVAELMAVSLDWDESEIDRQISDYESQVAIAQKWRE